MSPPASRNEEHLALTDEQLAAAYRTGGDNTLVAEIYHRYGHLVLGLCLKYMRNRMEAEDVSMQVFSGLLNDLRRHRIQYFKSWLYVYAKNMCLMALRRKQGALKRELELRDDVPLLMDFSSEAHLKEREEQIMALERALECLNENQRTCVRLFYLEDRSYAEISQLAGFTVKEVKSHIQNGKRNLKISLDKLNERAGEGR